MADAAAELTLVGWTEATSPASLSVGGAFRSSDPANDRSDEAGHWFAAPGGTLGKIRTWTDKPINKKRHPPESAHVAVKFVKY